jgi:hypothetical protein
MRTSESDDAKKQRGRPRVEGQDETAADVCCDSASPEPMLSAIRAGFTSMEEPLPLRLTMVFKNRDSASRY